MKRLRFYTIEIGLIAVLISAISYFGYLGYGLLRPSLVTEPFSGDQALKYAAKQMEFGDRIVGSKGSTQTGDWLVDQLRSFGWDVVIQPYLVSDSVSARNIIAIRGGKQSGDPVAILSTHYDTRLYADLDPNQRNHIQSTPGANAGASGVAVLLELARTLDVPGTGHTVCLAFFDAEDNGGLPGWDYAIGSAYFTQRLDTDIARCGAPQVSVYLDMVGATDQHFYAADTSNPRLAAAIWKVAKDLGYGFWFSNNRAKANVDAHDRFQQINVPAMTITGANYSFRYTQADTLDKLNPLSLERVGRTLKAWLERGAPF